MGNGTTSRTISDVSVRRYGLARGLGHAAWISMAVLMIIAVTIYAVTGHPMVAQSGIGEVIDKVGGFGSLGLAIAALLARFWPGTTRGSLGVGERGLTVTRDDGKVVTTFARDDLRNGWVIPSGVESVPPGVAFETKRGTRIEGRADSRDAAVSMLRDLGLDAQHRRYETILGSRVLSVVGGFFATSFALGALPLFGTHPGSAANIFIIAGAILVGFVTAQLLAPRALSVGADGLALDGRVGSRFIPYSDLDRVEVTRNGLGVHYKDGRYELAGSMGSIEAPEALERRIREAMNAGGPQGGSADALDALERQGRPFAAWRESITQWANSMGSLRDTGVATETLFELLKDGSAPAVKRIGAAIALLSRGEGHRDQLRAVAETSAEPHVRVALERVIEGEPLSEREVEALEKSSQIAGA
jgi:hypothetical protein